MYEPLEFVDALKTNPDGTNVVTPWLATGSTWNADYTTLTFTIRSGVTWSDGQPFSAADVLYTFDALKADAALDTNALWQANGGPLTNVALQGSDQVVFTFSGPAQTYFYYVADQIPIVLAAPLVRPGPGEARRVRRRDTRGDGTRTWCRAARRTTSSTCATRTTGRARRVIRCRRSPSSTTRPS